MSITIIIPTYNEEEKLPHLLGQLKEQSAQDMDVFIVDGGSTDQTISIAVQYGINVIESGKGRARQMNAAARLAQTEYLWFMHADTRLLSPVHAYLDEIKSSNSIWGRFEVKFDDDRVIFRMIAFMMNKRSALTSIATGDQAIFIKKNYYEESGGFEEIPLMEDIDISKKLKKTSSLYASELKLQTSARRWKVNGVLRTIILMWIIRFYYFLGVPAAKLAVMYDNEKS